MSSRQDNRASIPVKAAMSQSCADLPTNRPSWQAKEQSSHQRG